MNDPLTRRHDRQKRGADHPLTLPQRLAAMTHRLAGWLRIRTDAAATSFHPSGFFQIMSPKVSPVRVNTSTRPGRPRI